MPKPRARGGREGPKSADSGGAGMRTDEDILRERRQSQAFDVGDAFLRAVSWGLWGVAAAWFVSFGSAAPGAAPWCPAAGDALLGLLACGTFCGALAGASPGGTWSSWRVVWHAAWAPAMALLAVGFGLTASRGRPHPQLPPAAHSAYLAAALGAGAAGAVLTCPRGSPSPARATNATWGRALLALDGALGLGAAGAMLLGALAGAGGAGGAWAEPLGPAAVVVSAVPLAMWSSGACLCRTDAELIAAAPAALLFHAAAVPRALFAETGNSWAALFAALAALHVALYLPLPLADPDANPFHVWLRRFLRSFVQLLTEPVSGFGGDD